MRIALILTSLGLGGAERETLWLARRLASRGHAVKLLILRPRDAWEWGGGGIEAADTPVTLLPVTFLGIDKAPWSVLRGFRQAAGELRRFRPDVLHGHNFHGNLAARLLGRACGGIPVISTIHNLYEGGWGRMLAYRLSDWMSRRTIAVSEAARERYVRLKAAPEAKSGVIPNGIEMDEFVPNAARRVQMRLKTCARENFVWLAVGRLVPAKDYPNLLRSFALAQTLLAAARDERYAELWVAGSGEAEFAEELRRLAGELGVADSVRWLGAKQDVAALLDAADGFVLASAWEGMPLAVGEAMAMAKPIVATDVGGVRELAGETGKLVPAGDSDALAEAMGSVMDLSAGDRERMGEAAWERVCEGFSMETKAEEWERVYEELAG